MSIPMWLAQAIAWSGLALVGFAILDGLLSLFDLHITGGEWSPVAEFAGGLVLRYFGEALVEE